MDPSETLALIFQHLTDGNVQDAQRHMGYLRDWMESGGFRPDAMTALALIRQQMEVA